LAVRLNANWQWGTAPTETRITHLPPLDGPPPPATHQRLPAPHDPRHCVSKALDGAGVLADAHYRELPQDLLDVLVVGKPIAET
jgi:hypothetical protein